MLPPVRYIQAGPALPEASPAIAAAQGEAMARLGNTISQVGERGFQVAEKIRKMDEAGKTAAFFANLDQRASGFANELLSRTDPSQWPQDWRKLTEEFKQHASGLALSPEGRASLELELQDWSTRRTIAFESQAAQRVVEESRASLAGGLSHALGRGDSEAADRYLRLMPGAGFMPSEIEDARRTTSRGLASYDLQQDAELDPARTLERLQDPDFLALPGNESLTLADRDRARAAAESELRALTGRTTDHALDAIAEHQIATPEEIDAHYPTLRPAARARLKAHLAAVQDEAYQATLATPAVQASLAGELAAGLASWKPQLEDFDAELVRLSSLLSQISPGPMKDQFKERLDAIKTNAQTRAKSVLDLGRDALQSAFDSGSFGPPTATAIKDEAPTLGALLDDGYLHDLDRLQSYGFSLEQAREIRKADEDSDSKTNSLDTFRRLHVERPNDPNPNVITPWHRSVFQAIRDHSGPTTRIPGPQATEAVTTSQARYGKALLRYEDWAAQNPDPTYQEVQDFATDLGVSNAADHLRRAILPPPPQPPSLLPPLGSLGSQYGPPTSPASAQPGLRTPAGAPAPPATVSTLREALPAPLSTHAQAFIEAGTRHGIDPRLLAAISLFETGSGTSSAFRRKNNAMGIYQGGSIATFDNVGASIDRMARSLANPKGPYAGARTLAEIGSIYSPPGNNDRRGTNHLWPASVGNFLRRLGLDPDQPLKP